MPDQVWWKLVVFHLDRLRIALPLAAVERVIRAVSVTPLPAAPGIVLGVINMQGQILPVFDFRRRFRLPARKPGIADQIVIARTRTRQVGIFADAVTATVSVAGSAIVSAASIAPDTRHIDGVLPLPDGVLLIHDLDGFLSHDEEQDLEAALDGLGRA